MTGRRPRSRPHSARRSQATQQQPIATCPECGKRAYTSKKSAKHGAAVLYPGDRMRVYQCPGTPWWHMTSQDADRVAKFRARRSSGPEPEV